MSEQKVQEKPATSDKMFDEIAGQLVWTKRAPAKLIQLLWATLADTAATPEGRARVALGAAQALFDEILGEESPQLGETKANLDHVVLFVARAFANLLPAKETEEQLRNCILQCADSLLARAVSLERSPDPGPPSGQQPATSTQQDMEKMVRESVAREIASTNRRRKCRKCGETLKKCVCIATPPPRTRAPPASPPAVATAPPPAVADNRGHQQEKIEDESEEDQQSQSEEGQQTPREDNNYNGFRDKKILLEPRRWEAQLESGSTPQDLERALRQEFVPPALSGYTADVAEMCVELCGRWAEDPADPVIPTILIDNLFRITLFQAGASPQEIAKAMRKIKGVELPRRYRTAYQELQAKTATTTERRQNYNPKRQPQQKGGKRIPPDIWNSFSQEQRSAVTNFRRN